jgi:membrane protein implicated in regulation of membrane protease activity
MAWLWLLVAAALGAAEFFTLTLAFGLLAAAAVVAAVVAGIGLPVLVQVLAFAGASAVGLIVVRPIAQKHMLNPPVTTEGAERLVGQGAVVIEEVSVAGGLVKLAGEEWTARTLDESHVIPEGAMVDVMEIEGATAVVYPRELLP